MNGICGAVQFVVFETHLRVFQVCQGRYVIDIVVPERQITGLSQVTQSRYVADIVGGKTQQFEIGERR